MEKSSIIKIINECIDEKLWNNKYINNFIKYDQILQNTESHIRIYELSYLKHLIENSKNENPLEILERKIKVHETPTNYENKYCTALLKGLKEYITKDL